MHPEQQTPAEITQRLNQIEGYLRSDPGNKDLLTMGIDLSLAIGDSARAARHADAACERYPNDPFFINRRGNVLLTQSNWSAAEPLFAKLLVEHPNVYLACTLADCQVRLGRHQDALATMTPYLAEPELPPRAATMVVRTLHHLGDFDGAQAMIAAHRDRFSGEPTFLAAASLLCLDAGDVAEAAALSDAALAAGAKPLEALVVTGTLALGESDTDTAIARFNEALSINPNEGRSWSGLGLSNLLKRDLAAAAAQLEQAVKFMPKHIGSWHALGWCRLFSQDLDQAAAAFQTALDLDRNFGESHGGVAVVAALRGQRAVAEAAIERAVRLDPQGLTARYAQMVLNGDAADPERFKAIAYRLMAGRTTPGGESLTSVVKRHVGD